MGTTRWMPPLAALAAAAAVPASAGAATGTTTIELAPRAKAAKSLRIAATSPAAASRTRIALPVAGGRMGAASAMLEHRGGLRLRARSGTRGSRRSTRDDSRRARRRGGPGRRRDARDRRSRRARTLALTSLRLELGGRSRITARIRGRRRTVFSVSDRGRTLRLDATRGTVRLTGARVRLTARGAAAIRRGLRVDRVARGAFGTLAVDAALQVRSTPPSPGAPPGDAPPPPAPITDELPVLARPATAVDVASATITWHPRSSFIQYINGGEGTRVSDGAVADPPTVEPGSDAPLTYTFRFPFRGGWFDPPSGAAGVTYRGGVTFSYRAHGIDLTTRDPEIEINGGASRAIFRIGDKRAVLVDLDPSRAKSRTVSPDGKTHTLEEIPAAIPQGGATPVFGGFYRPGDLFGWVSVSFTTG